MSDVSRVEMFGLPVDLLDMEQSVQACTALVEARCPAQHVVINAAKVVACQEDEDLRAIVAGAEIVNLDGMAVVWAGRLLGHSVPERVAGIDLMERLFGVAEVRDWPVYFLGARPEVLDRFLTEVRTRHPRLTIAGARDGYFDDMATVADQIAAAAPRLLFVGMSSPRKEHFVSSQRERLGPLLSFGVGGSFDVWAGVTQRAPLWMQDAGLEWLYRVVQEPGRLWHRYLVGNTRFLALTAREYFTAKRTPPGL